MFKKASKFAYDELGDGQGYWKSKVFYYENGKEIPKTTQWIAFTSLLCFFACTLILGFTMVTFVLPFISEMKFSKESTCKIIKNRQNCFYDHQNTLICQYVLQVKVDSSNSFIATLNYRYCPSTFTFCKQLDDGDRTKCWYNPTNIAEITIFKTSFSHVVIGSSIGVLIGVISISLLILFFYKRMKE